GEASARWSTRSRRKSWVFHTLSGAVAQFWPLILNPPPATSVAAPLLRLFPSAESLASRESSLIRIHSKPNVLLGLLFNVIAEFLVKFAFGYAFTQQRPQRGLQPAQHFRLLSCPSSTFS